jgi:hypothetical protein
MNATYKFPTVTTNSELCTINAFPVGLILHVHFLFKMKLATVNTEMWDKVITKLGTQYQLAMPAIQAQVLARQVVYLNLKQHPCL